MYFVLIKKRVPYMNIKIKRYEGEVICVVIIVAFLFILAFTLLYYVYYKLLSL